MERTESLQRQFASLLSQNARQWRRSLNETLKPLGLTEATWLPLLHLVRAGAPMLQKDLAQSLTLESSSVVRLLDELEANGLVTRTAVEDRRAKSICLTDLGRETVAQVEVFVDEARQRYLFDLTSQELEIAVRALRKVSGALAPTLDDAP